MSDSLDADLLWDLCRPMADNAPWKPTRYKVGCCGDIIMSVRPGAFARCQCGKSFVDQTREYVRCGGPKDFEVVDQPQDALDNN
jgi:hypothetical protein